MHVIVGVWSDDANRLLTTMKNAESLFETLIPILIPANRAYVRGRWQSPAKAIPNAASWNRIYALNHIFMHYPQADAFLVLDDDVAWTHDAPALMPKIINWLATQSNWDVFSWGALPLWTVHSRTEYVAEAPFAWGSFANMYHRRIIPTVLKMNCQHLTLAQNLSRGPWVKLISVPTLAYPTTPWAILPWGRLGWHTFTNLHTVNWSSTASLLRSMTMVMRDYDYPFVVYFSIIGSILIIIGLVAALCWAVVMACIHTSRVQSP
jgi:hypothetical protein